MGRFAFHVHMGVIHIWRVPKAQLQLRMRNYEMLKGLRGLIRW